MVREPGCGSPVMRRMSPSPSETTSLPGGICLSDCGAARNAGMVPDRPQRRILLAQNPQRKGLQPHLPRGAQFVQRGHRIQHPHLVAHVGIFIIVGKMRVQLIACQAQSALASDAACHPSCTEMSSVSSTFAGWCLLRQRHRPVVPVIADGADQLLFGHDLEHALQIVFKPVLGRDWSGRARFLVLVIVHQHDAVGVLCQFRKFAVVRAQRSG